MHTMMMSALLPGVSEPVTSPRISAFAPSIVASPSMRRHAGVSAAIHIAAVEPFAAVRFEVFSDLGDLAILHEHVGVNDVAELLVHRHEVADADDERAVLAIGFWGRRWRGRRAEPRRLHPPAIPW